MTTFIHYKIRLAVVVGISMLGTGCSMTSYLPDMPTLNWFHTAEPSEVQVSGTGVDEGKDGTTKVHGGDTVAATVADDSTSQVTPENAAKATAAEAKGGLASRVAALEQALAEVLGLKPSIEKVASLEKDMAFLVAQLNQTVDVTEFETEQRAQALNELPAELSVINDSVNDPAKLTLTPVTPDGAFIEAELEPLEDDVFISQPDAALQFPDTSLRALNSNASPATKSPAQQPAATANNPQESLRIEAAKPVKEFQSAVGQQFAQTKTSASSAPNQRITNRAQTSPRGEYSLHLVSLSETPNVKRAIKNLSDKLQGHVESMAFYTKPVSVNGKTIYRVQLNDYVSRAQALEACQRVRKVASYCNVTTLRGANAV